MANIPNRFTKGIVLRGESSDVSDNEEGSLFLNSSSARIKTYVEGAVREVITSSQGQYLTNKTISTAENTIQVSATGVTATELDAALEEIQSNAITPDSNKANVNLDNIVTTSIPLGVNLESLNTNHSTPFRIGTKNQTASSSGAVDLMTGNAPSSFRSGNLNIYTGSKNSATSSNTGNMSISTGTASGVDRATSSVRSGVLNITTGGVSDSNSSSGSGSILLKSGLVNRSNSNSGTVTIGTGNVSDSIGVSGKLTLETGMAFGDGSCATTGNIELRTGSNGDQKSGDIILSPGLAGTDEGTIYLGGKEINVTSRKITNLADGTVSTDAVNLKQLNSLKSSEMLFTQTFETAALTDFTQTGLSLSTSNPLHGEISALLTHQAGVSPDNDQSFKQVIPVDNKFRNQTMVLRLEVKSNASAGNVVINIYDETNSANLVASEQLQLSNDVNGKKTSVSFTIPETCASLSYTITALPEAGSPTTRIDDIICELAETALLETAVELTGDAQTITIPLTQSGLVQEADSEIVLSGFAGYGSSATTTIKFSSINSTGSVFSYLESPTEGGIVTVLQDGIYNISATALVTTNTVDARIAIVIKDELGNTIVNQDSRNTLNTATTNKYVAASLSRKMKAGWNFVIASQATHSLSSLTASATYQGSLKQVSVNPNSKITIPTSELRFEGASSRGSTATAIVKFDTIAKLRGDAFTVESDAVLGTRITMKKAGKLDVSASIFGTGINVVLTKNQAILTTGIANIAAEEFIAVHSTAGTARQNVAGTTFVQVGDIIRVATDVNPTAGIANNLNLSFQEQEIAVSVSNTLPQFSESDSSVRLDTANGYGSVATMIRRFSNQRDNIGTDILYVPSDVNGDSFVVKSAGIYHISFTDQFNSSQYLGISKNATSLTTSIAGATPVTERLAMGLTPSANNPTTISWEGQLSAGDVIRAHTSSQASGVVPAWSQFTISKVGKPNVTGVDVTPFVNVPQPEFGTARFSGNNGVTSGYQLFDNVNIDDGNGIFRISSSGSYHSITFLKNSYIDVHFTKGSNSLSNSAYSLGIYLDDQSLVFVQPGDAGSGNIPAPSASYSGKVFVGQVLTFFSSVSTPAYGDTTVHASIKATALSDQILTAPETFSTDTAALTYAGSASYTLSTLQNAPVGTFITFTYAANTNTRTQTVNTAPTQFASGSGDANANGIQIFTRAYNATSSAAQPAAIAIQIGKGLKGRSLDLYKNAGKQISGETSFYLFSNTEQQGIFYKVYDEITGILLIDSGFTRSSAVTVNRHYFSDFTFQTSGYLVINASKNPALTGLGLNTVAARGVNSAGTTYANSETVLVYDSTKTYDTHGALNTSTGVFTAPESGYYQVSAAVMFNGAAYIATQFGILNVYKNGTWYATLNYPVFEASTTNILQMQGSTGIFLAKGDTVSIFVRNSRGSTALSSNSERNYFSIHKTSLGTGN
jgi:hypothetical protein